MKLKLQRIPQAAEDARNIEHLPRKAGGNGWRQPEESCHVAMWTANGKARVVGLPNAVGIHIGTPCVLMSGIGLKIVFHNGFQSLVLSLLAILSHLLLGWVCLHCALNIRSMYFLKGLTAKGLP